MALILPRLDDSPYDDPLDFVGTWDATMALIEAAVGSGSGTGSGGASMVIHP